LFLASGLRKLVVVQLLFIAATSGMFFILAGSFQALSVWSGGAIALTNAVLLEWRRARAAGGRAQSAGESMRLLYRTAIDRFVLVALLFAVCLGVLKLDPLAVMTGFIAGQLGLIFIGSGRKN
jgi:ATP synthase protein I